MSNINEADLVVSASNLRRVAECARTAVKDPQLAGAYAQIRDLAIVLGALAQQVDDFRQSLKK